MIRNLTRWAAALLLAIGVGLALPACEDEGPAENFGESIDDAADEAADEAEDEAEDVADEAEDALE